MSKEIKKNEVIILYDEKKKKNLSVTIKEGEVFNTHAGMIKHEDILGRKEGESVLTNMGAEFVIFRPRACDHMMKVKRKTQIVYPKDAAWIILSLDLFPGAKVVEMGMGSGALTISIAQMVGEEGKVYSFDNREGFLNNALKNVERAGLKDRVEGRILEAGEEFPVKEVDAVFLDLPEPWVAIPSAYNVLLPGRTLGLIVPNAEQLKEATKELQENNFSSLEVVEILLRKMLVRNKRGVRPSERMIGFTGYLVTARKRSL